MLLTLADDVVKEVRAVGRHGKCVRIKATVQACTIGRPRPPFQHGSRQRTGTLVNEGATDCENGVGGANRALY